MIPASTSKTGLRISFIFASPISSSHALSQDYDEASSSLLE
jgi:hypothetical protein